MDKLQEISNYVGSMKIRKAFFGGYDKTDVEMKFGELQVMFKKCLEEEKAEQKVKLEEYEAKLQTSQLLMNEMNKKLCQMMEDQKNMKETYREYCSNILQKYSDSLKSLSTEFTQILENITNLQQNMFELDILEEIGGTEESLIETTKNE